MFPVGFVSNLFVSTPILDLQGKFKGFYEGWSGNRTFLLDMAGKVIFQFSIFAKMFCRNEMVEAQSTRIKDF